MQRTSYRIWAVWGHIGHIGVRGPPLDLTCLDRHWVMADSDWVAWPGPVPAVSDRDIVHLKTALNW